jgi:hypothetical protein
VKKFLHQSSAGIISRQQFTVRKMLMAAHQNFRMRNGGFALPDFFHAPMVNFSASDGNLHFRWLFRVPD